MHTRILEISSARYIYIYTCIYIHVYMYMHLHYTHCIGDHCFIEYGVNNYCIHVHKSHSISNLHTWSMCVPGELVLYDFTPPTWPLLLKFGCLAHRVIQYLKCKCTPIHTHVLIKVPPWHYQCFRFTCILSSVLTNTGYRTIKGQSCNQIRRPCTIFKDTCTCIYLEILLHHGTMCPRSLGLHISGCPTPSIARLSVTSLHKCREVG